MFHLPRAVIVLGLVSFLNDTASEMITPLLSLIWAAASAVKALIGDSAAFFTAAALSLLSLLVLWWFIPPRRHA